MIKNYSIRLLQLNRKDIKMKQLFQKKMAKTKAVIQTPYLIKHWANRIKESEHLLLDLDKAIALLKNKRKDKRK